MGNRRPGLSCRVQRRGPYGRPRAPALRGAAQRPCRRSADNAFRAAAQRPRQGGGVQPHRLAPTARSVVSTGEAGTDDARITASCKAAVPESRDNGGTTGFNAHCLPGGFGGCNSPLQDDAKSCLQPPRAAPTGALRVFQSGRNGLCSRPASTPRDSHPQVRAINTYPSGRCEHA